MGGGFTDFLVFDPVGDVLGIDTNIVTNPEFVMDPIGTTIADSIGFNSPWDYATSWAWDWPGMFAADWRALKHLFMSDPRKDRESMVNAPDTPRRIIYGRVRVSGQICYVCTSGEKSQYLHIIVAFAGHPITSFESIWLDDKLITDSQFANNVYYELYDGTQTGACNTMIAASGGLWSGAHIGYGIPYIYCRFTYSDGSFPAGLPVIKAVILGKRVYDPRTGATAYSTNPACCALDYMMLPEFLGGMGCDISPGLQACINAGVPYLTSSIADEIKIETVVEAANYCDQAITLPGIPTELRYTCNGTLDVNKTPAALLAPIMACMDANPVYMQGQWYFCINMPKAANLAVIDESWLNGGITFKTGANKNELGNTGKGTYVNPLDHWASTDFPVVQIPAYLAADGEELTVDKSFSFTQSPYMAQRLVRLDIERSRICQMVSYPCNLKALSVVTNDVVKVNNTLLGWSERLFRVLDWQFAPTGGINLTLGVENPNIYDVGPGDLSPVAVPALTNLPSPWYVPAPIVNRPTEALYIGSKNSIQTRVAITWQQFSSGISSWNVQASDDGGSTWRSCGSTVTPDIIIYDEPNGAKTYRIQAVNGIGAVSEWTSINYTVLGKLMPPSNVQNISAAATSFGGLIIQWSAVPDLDIDHYEIRWSANSLAGWENSISLGVVSTNTITIPAALDGIYLVKAVDTSNIESLAAASVITSIPSLINYNVVDTADDGTSWSGTKVGCYNRAGVLCLDMAGVFDSIADFDALMNIDTFGGALTEGYYTISKTISLASVQTARCSVNISYSAVDTSSYFDGWMDFDTIVNFDGTTVAGVMVQPQIRISQDGIIWSNWQSFIAGDYTALQFEFRLKLETNISYNIPEVTSFGITVDMADRAERGQGVSVAAGGTAITFARQYMVPPIVRTTIQGASSGDTEKITSISITGFTIQILNGGSGVARTIDWQAVGY